MFCLFTINAAARGRLARFSFCCRWIKRSQESRQIVMVTACVRRPQLANSLRKDTDTLVDASLPCRTDQPKKRLDTFQELFVETGCA
jgi:hypothetical protein